MLKLVENKVLDVAIDQNTQRPFPVEVGFKIEGNFANNKEDGWLRMLFHNKQDYAISWFKDGKFNGYCYRKDVEDCSTNLEAQFQDDELI